MLNSNEKRILEIINNKLLITEKELNEILKKENIDGAPTTFRKFVDSGFIEKITSLGTCIVITQKGMRALRDK